MKLYLKIISKILLIFAIAGNDCYASDLVFGPYDVGFKSYQTYDYSRAYRLDSDIIPRPLLVHYWYPSKGKIKGDIFTYSHYIDLIAQREDYGKSKSEINEHSFNYIKGYSDYAKQNFGLDTALNTQEILDSPVFARSGIPIENVGPDFPLLIYAPSNGKASVQNHLLCEYLASHGYMILSVASAGPNSINRDNIEESAMPQVTDLEYMLKYCVDSLHFQYTNLGLFGFSSGGNAITLFQMRHEKVDAVMSLDGGQEYSAYMKIYKMKEFDLDKTNKPYCTVVNNYENYSIYPYYHSTKTSEKYMFRMPYLNHYGFVSNWLYFDSCTPGSNKSKVSISFENLSECALGFFSKYLNSKPSLFDKQFVRGSDNEFIQLVDLNYSGISKLCNTLLDNDLESSTRLLEDHQTALFEGENQLNILGRMVVNKDMAIWLYLKSAIYQPNLWRTHYSLGILYKEKGETLLAKNALLKAKELNPENDDITKLLDGLKSHS